MLVRDRAISRPGLNREKGPKMREEEGYETGKAKASAIGRRDMKDQILWPGKLKLRRPL